MVNGADEVPGFVLARSWSRREQFGLGGDMEERDRKLTKRGAHPPLHPCPPLGSPQVEDFHTCAQETQAVASPGLGRGHTVLSCEDKVGIGR